MCSCGTPPCDGCGAGGGESESESGRERERERERMRLSAHATRKHDATPIRRNTHQTQHPSGALAPMPSRHRMPAVLGRQTSGGESEAHKTRDLTGACAPRRRQDAPGPRPSTGRRRRQREGSARHARRTPGPVASLPLGGLHTRAGGRCAWCDAWLAPHTPPARCAPTLSAALSLACACQPATATPPPGR